MQELSYNTNTSFATYLLLGKFIKTSTSIIGFVNGNLFFSQNVEFINLLDHNDVLNIYTNYLRIRRAEGKKKEVFPMKPNTVSHSNA